MDKKPGRDEINKFLFINLVMMFSSAAMQQLGKLIDPATGKTAVNLDAAQSSIDMIQMLNDKAAGNLDDDEKRLLKQTLSTLQLNYVEVAESAASAKPAAEASKTEPPPAAGVAS